MSALWQDNPAAIFVFAGYFAFCVFAVAATMWIKSFWLRLLAAEIIGIAGLALLGFAMWARA
jgi:hypothetical protein